MTTSHRFAPLLLWLQEPTTQIALGLIVGALVGDWRGALDADTASALVAGALPLLLRSQPQETPDQAQQRAALLQLLVQAAPATMAALHRDGPSKLPLK
ncbi:hypothetical protein E3E12_08030 [Formicincola oecophyllae]|uniref:Uncharacterized protein n=1 Tax=Formicincola oecophyllae TaxID=2558361 RepID=A0A4Y6UAB2_9PROT|nr:hypothetical protein [Formicincola oecophyllae]QDH14144.1 hypothetical protein E3E12_08030 [Formicincola oecophyllae]